jgi:HK97 family phage major capsid protein
MKFEKSSVTTLHRKLETRSFPTLLEQRNTLLDSMDVLLNKAKTETRAMSEEENTQFEQAKTQVEQIDKTLAAEEAAKQFNQSTKQQEQQQQSQQKQQAQQQQAQSNTDPEKRALEENNFLKFIRGEERALDVGGNGGIIPETISNRIIERVRELCPIYNMATVFNVGGDLIFPSYDPKSITTSYVADMTQLTAANGNFTTVKLQNFIAGSLTQVSRSLMNRTDFDVVAYIVEKMSQSIAAFLERELLVGAGGTTAATGVFTDTGVTAVTAGSATAIAIDDLITTQMAIPDPFQTGASWIMNRSVFQGIRLLKDTTGMPYLNRDLTSEFGWQLLGKPVYLSENAPGTIATGLSVLGYGDFSGLYVKVAQNVEIAILNELYATSYATGIVGYVEFDSKVIEPQRITKLKML